MAKPTTKARKAVTENAPRQFSAWVPPPSNAPEFARVYDMLVDGKMLMPLAIQRHRDGVRPSDDLPMGDA
jgi:hypothetical protein